MLKSKWGRILERKGWRFKKRCCRMSARLVIMFRSSFPAQVPCQTPPSLPWWCSGNMFLMFGQARPRFVPGELGVHALRKGRG
eukprot:5131552-Pyramimonas_sp.AAC.1